MGPFDQDWLLKLLITLPPLLFSLTLHEYAHARVALAFGDRTAYLMGRVSLNPLRHLDFLGTMMLIFSGLIGWAKPVPVNPLNLEPRRLGDIMVSAAGLLANLVLAGVCALLFQVWMKLPLPAASAGAQSGLALVGFVLMFTAQVNLALCFFNVIPLYPLDGHHILRELLPADKQGDFMQWQVRTGPWVLLSLVLGPPLLKRFTGHNLIDPLGLYLYGVIKPILSLLGFPRFL